MNPISLYLASGESLYAGLLLQIVVMLAFRRARNHWLIRLRNLLAWIALALIVMACPPLGLWWYAAFLLAFVAWFTIENRTAWQAQPRLRDFAAVLILVLGMVVFIHEWPRRQTLSVLGASKTLSVLGASKTLCVVGDSISSGIDAGHPPWPEVYAKRTGVTVHNLSRPGIGVAEARQLADQIPGGEKIVLLEIGGNDILSGTPAADFERDLDALLEKSHPGTDALLMMELPLLPHMIEYGRIQRRLALKHHAILIPKRHFIAILAGANATSDGLHLSPEGTEKTADLVDQLISWR